MERRGKKVQQQRCDAHLTQSESMKQRRHVQHRRLHIKHQLRTSICNSYNITAEIIFYCWTPFIYVTL